MLQTSEAEKGPKDIRHGRDSIEKIFINPLPITSPKFKLFSFLVHHT